MSITSLLSALPFPCSILFGFRLPLLRNFLLSSIYDKDVDAKILTVAVGGRRSAVIVFDSKLMSLL